MLTRASASAGRDGTRRDGGGWSLSGSRGSLAAGPSPAAITVTTPATARVEVARHDRAHDRQEGFVEGHCDRSGPRSSAGQFLAQVCEELSGPGRVVSLAGMSLESMAGASTMTSCQGPRAWVWRPMSSFSKVAKVRCLRVTEALDGSPATGRATVRRARWMEAPAMVCWSQVSSRVICKGPAVPVCMPVSLSRPAMAPVCGSVVSK